MVIWRFIVFLALLTFSLPGFAQWMVTDLDSGGANQGEANAIAIDSQGRVHVVYTNRLNLGALTFRQLGYKRRDFAGTWSDYVGVSGSLTRVGNIHSLVLSEEAAFVAYHRESSNDLYLARRPLWPDDNTLRWERLAIDSAGDVGLNPSAVLSRSGQLYVTYFDDSNERLKMARFDTADGAIVFESLEDLTPVQSFHRLDLISLNPFENIQLLFQRTPPVDSEMLGIGHKLISGMEALPLPAGADVEAFTAWRFDTLLSSAVDGGWGVDIPVDLGDRFDMETEVLTGFHLCFYDEEEERLMYAQVGNVGGVISRQVMPVMETVAGPGAVTAGPVDDCSLAVCGNRVHIIARRDIQNPATGLERHAYRSYSRPFDAPNDVPWEWHTIQLVDGSLHDPNWNMSAACDAQGGLHIVFPVRAVATGVDLKYGYLAPAAPTCGDLICNADETVESCESDCIACGDGVCSGEPLENSLTCPSDCGSLVAVGALCGDLVCETDEAERCLIDCAIVPSIVGPVASGTEQGGGPPTGFGVTGGVGGGGAGGTGGGEASASGGGCSLVYCPR